MMLRQPAGSFGVLEADRERLEGRRINGIDQPVWCLELAERPLDLDLPDGRGRDQDVVRGAGDRGSRTAVKGRIVGEPPEEGGGVEQQDHRSKSSRRVSG